MSRLLQLALVLLGLVSACNDAESRTQITFRIDASTMLVDRIAKLTVTVSGAKSVSRDFQANELTWPVDIVVYPATNNRGSYSVTLDATAYDGSGQMIAHAATSQSFKPKMNVPAELSLDLGGPVSDAGTGLDAGMNADAATDAASADSGRDTGTSSRDAGGGQTQEDAQVTPPNCATLGSNVVCDDSNGCNGTEACDPNNPVANANGCVSGTSIACASGMTCDQHTGMCSRCATTRDGDGDGVDSISCGGTDCDDADPTVAPGKPEVCDGKDNDCDQVVDGTAADANCASSAPRDGVATCVGGRCASRCTNPDFQIENGACVAPPVSCPMPNPCAPGSCASGASSYSCTCPSGYRAGIGATRCAALGAPKRTIGFETNCDGTPTAGMPTDEYKDVAANLYAACGVAAITTGGLTSQAQLIVPTTTVIAGITGQAALAGGAVTGMTVAPDDLVIAFSPGVNELDFDALDLDNLSGLRVTLEGAGGAMLFDLTPAAAAATKSVKFSQQSATPIERATIHYAQSAAGDAWFLDQLTIDVWGCGDGEREMQVGEACDDGNTVQCDGCDNACATSLLGCQSGNACTAGSATDAGLCAP